MYLEIQVYSPRLFPATYAANGYYTIIFGGVSLEKNIISLLFIILVTQLVVVIVICKKGILHMDTFFTRFYYFATSVHL
ncbi:hypothetical protein CN285_07875 [Bacillus cereus]|nr:hypothetical protein CN285_07875 [Bacillus cereus]